MTKNKNSVLKSFKEFIINLDEIKNETLVSFMWKDDLQQEIFGPQYCDQYFHINKPEKNYSITGIDIAIEFNKNTYNTFSSLEGEFQELKRNSINNFNKVDNTSSPPLFFCYKKFDSEKKTSTWEAFKSFSVYIPQLILIKDSQTDYCIFNFLLNVTADKEKVLKSFDSILHLKTSDYKSDKKIKDINDQNPSMSKLDWNKLIIDTIPGLNNGVLNKVVLSRSVTRQLKTTPKWKELLSILSKQFPSCYIYLLKSADTYFIGASPERFLSVSNNKISIEAIAGSAPIGENETEEERLKDELLGNSKIIKEHSIVVEFVEQILKKYSEEISVSNSPEILKLENIQHVVTKFASILTNTGSLLNLVDELFPTPAVCGYPKAAAIDLIRKLETHDRGLYSGLLGWMNLDSDCDFTAAIRCALINNATAEFFAGAGIVAESKPEEEFIETELKLKPMLSLFENENKSK